MNENNDLTVVPALTEVATAAPAVPVAAVAAICLNCGARITGRYCQSCGQRHDPHVHTVGHFLTEATEDLTHADSRVWRTLFALMFKPGYLTQQFFAGRRASYLPPVRLYLVVSVLLFLLVSAVPGASDKVIVLDAKKGTTHEASSSDCAFRYLGPGGSWVEPMLRAGCRKALADNGVELKRSFLHNAPRAMFVFLPLIAFFMMLLYWRPRRYYVEHLLFYIHNHAFVFLAASLAVITDSLPFSMPDLVPLLFMIYLGWYFFRATRVFYAQGRFLTAIKLTFMGFVYLILAALMIALTTLISMVTL